MLNVPPEIFEFNIISHRNSLIHKKCRHRKWYKWFTKPHYKKIKKLPREDAAGAAPGPGLDDGLAPGPGPGPAVVVVVAGEANAQVEHIVAVEEATLPITIREPGPVQAQRRVRIDDVPYEIGTNSCESGIDSTLTSTPNIGRVSENSHNHNHSDDHRAGGQDEQHDDDDEDDDDDGDTTLLAPVDRDEMMTSNRDSFVSADDFQSVSSLVSGDYTPSVTTASMKSLYYSLPSESSSWVQIWQPEGEARS